MLLQFAYLSGMQQELTLEEFEKILGKDKASEMLDEIHADIAGSEEFKIAPLNYITASFRVIEGMGESEDDDDDPLWIMIQCGVEKLQDGNSFHVMKITLTDTVDNFLDKFNEFRLEAQQHAAIPGDHQDAPAPH